MLCQSKRHADIGTLALHNAWSPILASIFAGNGVVLKCSEKVIWSSTWFVEAIQKCLEACGHDPNLVQVKSLLYLSSKRL